jgi:hypothetical protein
LEGNFGNFSFASGCFRGFRETGNHKLLKINKKMRNCGTGNKNADVDNLEAAKRNYADNKKRME